LVWELEGERAFGKFRCRSEDNIRIDLKERGYEVVDWMHLDQDRDQWRALLNTVMEIRVP
jgi:hypothetical protein